MDNGAKKAVDFGSRYGRESSRSGDDVGSFTTPKKVGRSTIQASYIANLNAQQDGNFWSLRVAGMKLRCAELQNRRGKALRGAESSQGSIVSHPAGTWKVPPEMFDEARGLLLPCPRCDPLRLELRQ